MLGKALLAGASGQLRNKATTAGNLLQRTRCYYFYDTSKPCNKREPARAARHRRVQPHHGGAGRERSLHRDEPLRHERRHAGARRHRRDDDAQGAARSIPMAEFHRLPGDTPQIETSLRPGELITAVTLPKPVEGVHLYRKVRDRASYAFATVSVAAIIAKGRAASRVPPSSPSAVGPQALAGRGGGGRFGRDRLSGCGLREGAGGRPRLRLERLQDPAHPPDAARDRRRSLARLRV